MNFYSKNPNNRHSLSNPSTNPSNSPNSNPKVCHRLIADMVDICHSSSLASSSRLREAMARPNMDMAATSHNQACNLAGNICSQACNQACNRVCSQVCNRACNICSQACNQACNRVCSQDTDTGSSHNSSTVSQANMVSNQANTGSQATANPVSQIPTGAETQTTEILVC